MYLPSYLWKVGTIKITLSMAKYVSNWKKQIVSKRNGSEVPR